MRVAYINAFYRLDNPTGGNAHIGQFIDNCVALGHEVWTERANQHPAVRRIPSPRLKGLITLRAMDVVYIRMEWKPPSATHWAISPYRYLIGNPVIVWEFNATPDFGQVVGQKESDIVKATETFRRYGKGCDLAVCVSQNLADYVHSYLGIRRVLTVPNGSDPDLFRPDTTPVSSVCRSSNHLNVVWIGSAHLTWHNFELLQSAAQLLWSHGAGDRISFHIIGKGFKKMRDMPPNVNYYGSENYEMLPHWLAVMDVGLALYHPGSANYNSPLKLFDYMASGLTVVATFHPQIRKVFDELRQPDLLVSPDDPKALMAVLLRLASDRERVRAQGEAGRQLVIEFYNWRRAVQDTLHEIEHIVQERK